MPNAAPDKSRRHTLYLWVERTPWRRKWQRHLEFLPGKPLGKEAWWATVHRVAEELEVTSQLNNKNKSLKSISDIIVLTYMHLLSSPLSTSSSVPARSSGVVLLLSEVHFSISRSAQMLAMKSCFCLKYFISPSLIKKLLPAIEFSSGFVSR